VISTEGIISMSEAIAAERNSSPWPSLRFIGLPLLVLAALAGIFGPLAPARAADGHFFNMPSGSMKPTLLVGDGFYRSEYTAETEPKRGDVALFHHPREAATVYVKRIIGLPGDRIQMRAGVLVINDVPVKRERVEDFIDEEDGGARVIQWRITLPEGVSYLAIDLQPNGPLDNTDVYAVPPGHYFMLGDNLDNSTDSRVPQDKQGVGYVPFENLIGRATFIFYSNRFNRIGRTIQ
jgi:signal peptidase I